MPDIIYEYIKRKSEELDDVVFLERGLLWLPAGSVCRSRSVKPREVLSQLKAGLQYLWGLVTFLFTPNPNFSPLGIPNLEPVYQTSPPWGALTDNVFSSSPERLWESYSTPQSLSHCLELANALRGKVVPNVGLTPVCVSLLYGIVVSQILTAW